MVERVAYDTYNCHFLQVKMTRSYGSKQRIYINIFDYNNMYEYEKDAEVNLKKLKIDMFEKQKQQ